MTSVSGIAFKVDGSPTACASDADRQVQTFRPERVPAAVVTNLVRHPETASHILRHPDEAGLDDERDAAT
jgi:hypothetical protein